MILVLLCVFSPSILANPSEYSHHGNYEYPRQPLASIGPDGRVMDTPEVAHARAAHLAALTAASSRVATADYVGPESGAPSFSGYYSSPTKFSNRVHHAEQGYRGPPAPLDDHGHVTYTPEVAHARNAHFAAYAAAAASNIGYLTPLAQQENHSDDYQQHESRSPVNRPSYQTYHGPVAPLDHDGRVMDTPEVARAKAAHLAAFAKAAHGDSRYNYYGDY